ncbi:hypothetical protein RRG08_056595 [Elysia crispata]|uniref:Uncharacterized protein n=1 Tax=Elysia crispata TaxID=231223 RepID=A0AAE0Z6I9_9GAST|nr:hypothetical protein RRG08_056595 [Elysia crispata]
MARPTQLPPCRTPDIRGAAQPYQYKTGVPPRARRTVSYTSRGGRRTTAASSTPAATATFSYLFLCSPLVEHHLQARPSRS